MGAEFIVSLPVGENLFVERLNARLCLLGIRVRKVPHPGMSDAQFPVVQLCDVRDDFTAMAVHDTSRRHLSAGTTAGTDKRAPAEYGAWQDVAAHAHHHPIFDRAGRFKMRRRQRVGGQNRIGKDPDEMTDLAASGELHVPVEPAIIADRALAFEIRKASDSKIDTRPDSISHQNVVTTLKSRSHLYILIDRGMRPDDAFGTKGCKGGAARYG